MTKTRVEIEGFPLERIASGVKGLDTVLKGGFLSGGVYLFLAPPGGGKTILANQISFHQASKGRRVVYVTLLAESHSRMFAHMKSLKFFDRSKITNGITFIGGYHFLEKEGLEGLLTMLRQTVRREKPALLILDGTAVADEMSMSAVVFKKFVHELNTFLTTSNCTCFMLSSLKGGEHRPEYTMVDGILSLTMRSSALQTVREIEVRKFRGSAHLTGRHYFKISEAGIEIFPRTETIFGHNEVDPNERYAVVSSGIKTLDDMLGGGLVNGSTTMIMGTVGSGKTSLGLHFLSEGASQGETGLYFGFYETATRLVRKANNLGFDMVRNLNDRKLFVEWRAPLEFQLDEIASRLFETIRKRKIKRLFIDGTDGLYQGMMYPERLNRWFTAVTNELRFIGVTTMITEETPLGAPKHEAHISNLSAVTENLIYLFHDLDEHGSENLKVKVIKSRECNHDRQPRAFNLVSGHGVQINPPKASARSKPTKKEGKKQTGSKKTAKFTKRDLRKKR